MSDPGLDSRFNDLAHAVLDGVAGEADAARLSAEIEANPARAREFARLSMLHDALERACAAGADGRTAARRQRVFSVARRVALVAALIAFAAGASWLALGTGRTASADDVLARIADVARKGDRTYYLRAIGASKAAPAPKGSGRPQPTIDGAILYLRAPDSYVLARIDANGDEALTGSDGRSGWIVPAKGAVRVSRDPSRFSGSLPGSKQAIAFVDPHGDLSALSAAYELKLEPAPTIDGFSRVVATRKSDARGGPKRIEIAYDPATAVIRAMRLENLPQARGGPRSVEFELIDDAPLDARFFSHDFHHGSDREVIQED